MNPPVRAGAVEILPARRSDLGDITDFLKREWPEFAWPVPGEHVHVGNWMPGNDDYGLRLLAGGELAGFLGASRSLHSIDGVDRRFCAIGPWFVKAEHRAHSLPMLMKLLADKELTYINFTPSREMFKLFSYLGFAKLDEAKLLIPPFLNLPAYRPWRGRLVSAPAAIRAVLPSRELKIFEDHAATRCSHLAIVEGDRVCYLAAGRRIMRRLPFAELLHVSEPALVVPHLERIVWALCRRLRAVSVASDERLLAGAPVRAIRYRLNAPPLFKSAHVGRERISNMWSELVL